MSLEASRDRMQSFAKRNILYVNSRVADSGVDKQVRALGLKPMVVQSVAEVSDKTVCPHIDTIVVDSLELVRARHLDCRLG